MGVKFIADRRCAVKTSLTLTGLIEALRHQDLLRQVMDMVAAGRLPLEDQESRLDRVVLPETGACVNMSYRELSEQVSVLDEHRPECHQCPSALDGAVGGCIAYVPYPISEGLEYLLWLTAARALDGQLPESLLPAAKAFADKARGFERTTLADSLRIRGDLVGGAPRVHTSGFLFRQKRVTSAQVLDAFFANGVLTGDELRIHQGFLAAALALARAMEPAMRDRERRQALIEDVEPYWQVHELMARALSHGLGVYVWP